MACEESLLSFGSEIILIKLGQPPPYFGKFTLQYTCDISDFRTTWHK